MHGKTKTLEILSSAISQAKKSGFEAEAVWHAYREQTMRSAWGEVHQTPSALAGVLSLRLRDGLRAASVTTAECGSRSIRDAVKRCIVLLREVPENPYLPELLSQPQDLPEEELDMQDIVEDPEDLSVKERAFQEIRQSSQGTDLQGSARFFTAGCELAVANTRGLARYHTASYSFLSLVVTGERGLSSYADRAAAFPRDVDVASAIEEAFSRAALMRELPFIDPFHEVNSSISYDAVFSHYAVGEWLYWLSMSSFNGLDYTEGRSFLSGRRIGERVTGTNVTIHDDWRNPLVIPLPFDFEGHSRQRLPIIEEGVWRSVPYDAMTARKAGVSCTGHSGSVPLCVVMQGGDESFEELVERTAEPAIVATYFNYPSMPDTREGIFTATTRHGTFLVEDGKYRAVCPPLRLRVRSFDALSRIDGMTSSRLIRGQENYGMFYPKSLVVPAVRIRNVEFVGSNPTM